MFDQCPFSLITREAQAWWNLYNFLEKPGAAVDIFALPARTVQALTVIGNEVNTIQAQLDKEWQRKNKSK